MKVKDKFKEEIIQPRIEYRLFTGNNNVGVRFDMIEFILEDLKKKYLESGSKKTFVEYWNKKGFTIREIKTTITDLEFDLNKCSYEYIRPR